MTFHDRVCALAMLLAGSLAHAAQPEAAKPVQTIETEVQPAPEPGAMAFNFKDAPFDLVIDFFSRETGLPVIREAEPPSATMTFISAESYGFDEALSILNLNLRMHGLHLRREARFLYLSTLEDAARKPGPFAAGAVPDDLPPDRMVTVTFPLNNALASSIAEQIKPLVGPFGGVTPVESQNMVIVVESADQARRIGRVIRAIDEVPPADSEYRLFVLEHAEPETAVNALKGLVGQREKTIIIDKDGKQRTVDDLTVPGINLQADPRTNAVIAVGPRGRIDVVEELIALIDRPAGDATAELRTFDLAGIEPDEAKKQLDALFAAVPDDRRPRVLPLRDVGKVSVVASPSLLTQAAALLNAMDPDSSAPSGADAARVIALEHLDAARAMDIADRLLTPAQRRSLRLAPAPDGGGLVVAGPAERIASLAALLAGLDAPREADRDVRLVRIARGEPEAVLRRALNLYQQTGRAEDAPVEARVEDGSRTATLVGPAAAVREVERLIATAAGLDAAAPTPRLYEPEVRKPSELATRMRRLAHSLTIEPDAPDEPPAVFEPLDDLGTLVVRATPRQHSIIEPLIARLDSPNSEDQAFRVMRLSGTNPLDLVERARTLLAGRAESNPSLRGVNAEFDEASGSLLLTGPAEGLDAFSAALEQLRRLTPPGRTTRLIDVRNARAGDVLVPLQDLLANADSIDPARAVPEPTIRVVEATNGLLVTAEDAQHRLIESFVGRLDRLEPTDLPPLKLLQLRSADATQIASMLNDQYRKRAQAERAAKPVDVRSDAATNTLIVSAHESLFDEIKQFVDSINAERLDGPERVTVLFPLKVAKAVDVARAMDTLYPEPPIPLDRRGRPMPWLREPKEVTVTAEPGSNALIIDAPADRVESLRELASKLDRVELPQVAELRTYRIVDADLSAVARTLSNLARRGNLSGPAQPGRQPVDVVIETEPLSGTLIVAGDEITFERVGAMLDDLSAVPTQREVRVAPIANASAEDVRSRALEIYVAQIEGDPRAGEVSVSIDDDSNALMVVGETDDVDRFVGILDQLQRQIGPAREVRLIDLRFATPARVVAFLEDVRDSSRTFLSSGGVDPSFQAIEETGSLLVAAQPDQIPVIEQLIQSLDAEDAAEAPPLRIIRLRTTDASNLAGVLQSAYERRPATERSLRPVDIRADAATNTLIVSAHPELLPEIESIANELNETQTVTGDDREIRIFPLRIARAEDLARTIDAMFPEPPMPIDPRTRRARPDLRQPREVVVRADRATNSLIVDRPRSGYRDSSASSSLSIRTRSRARWNCERTRSTGPIWTPRRARCVTSPPRARSARQAARRLRLTPSPPAARWWSAARRRSSRASMKCSINSASRPRGRRQVSRCSRSPTGAPNACSRCLPNCSTLGCVSPKRARGARPRNSPSFWMSSQTPRPTR
ncbi:MAG: secretin N-terminal domain-containing protein [Planctomycetota bacterium]